MRSLLFLPVFVGCNDSYKLTNDELRSLTEAESAILSESIEVTDAILSVMGELAGAADQSSIFDAEGTVGASAFLAETENGFAAFKEYFAAGQVYTYSSDVYIKNGRYNCSIIQEKRTIAVRDLFFEVADQNIPSVVIHEGIHAFYGIRRTDNHSGKLEDLVIASEDHIHDPAVLDEVIASGDSVYLSEYFLLPSAIFYYNINDALASTLLVYQDGVAQEIFTREEALEEYRAYLTLFCDDAVAAQAGLISESYWYFNPVFEVTDDDMHDAFEASGLCETMVVAYDDKAALLFSE
ncbi:hypothetical protein HZC31_03215 [Candidatus Woesearchaeota archaeon]|nr:hypothetical protein [Candidatus Woesearchaeota archaeon]